MFDIQEVKRFCTFNFIGSLVLAALVAVIAVLVGSFTESLWRAIFTLLMVVTHSVLALGFAWNTERQDTLERFSFFGNTLFFLIIASFFLSIFGIWEVVTGEHVWNTYQLIFVLAFAALHGDILAKTLGNEKHTDIIVYVNYAFMGLVVVMLIPVIYMSDAFRALGEFYFRALAAAGIVDGTLTILALIFHRLYLHKNPRVESALENDKRPGTPKSERGDMSGWVWLLIIFLIFQAVLFFVRVATRGFF